MARICVFDVNETLLDLRALDPAFDEIFGDPTVRKEWFGQMLQLAMVATITGIYEPFITLGDAALTMIANRRSLTLRDVDRRRILDGMRRLPPHSDVVPALERLRAAGLRIVTLTNSNYDLAEAQLVSAGLKPYIEQCLSVEEVRRLKPAPEVYQMAANRLGVPINHIRLIAAHAWDIVGALRVGCAAAFVARPGMVLDPLAPPPDVIGSDLITVAEQIVAVELGQDRSTVSENQGRDSG
ncbi:haloacid dehalogenase type II [Chloroflexus sp.]|uniref:haloacid dehalogenase type II n=1 Tax=Chloroflexus sp. TaxID=1904827 RepID=UPI003C733CF0